MYIPRYLWINRPPLGSIVTKVTPAMPTHTTYFKSDGFSWIIKNLYWFCYWGLDTSISSISEVKRMILTAFGVKAVVSRSWWDNETRRRLQLSSVPLRNGR